MAEAVVSFAVDRVKELLISEAKLLYEVSGQIDEIQRELIRLQRFLEEADKKQNQDERVRQWVDEMRDLSFRTEDVIETFALEVTTKKEKSGLKALLRRFACILSEGVSRHKIATEINDIKAKLSNLTARLPTYGISGLKEEASDSLVNLKNSRIFYAHDVEKDFVGMQTEIAQLISHLKREETGWEAVSICGMGGQGKTTIAQKLYNHPEVRARFEVFAWACITQKFDRERVLKGLLKELLPHRKEEVSTMEDAELVKELYKVQQEKSCLIVIDDIWTGDAWRKLKSAFPVGETSSLSKLLVTTRNETLASKVGSVHKIEGLTEEEGWQLLSRKAGLHDISDKRVVSDMERIGRNMVKECKGLPLAISSLGGLLRGKLLREWEIINKDVSFYLAKDDEYYTVRQVLGLSYDSLPPRLRHCFLCFANYEEDEEIDTDGLYMFWMAEGLISLEDKAEGEMMLDVAERYLDELAHRSLVQVQTNDVQGWSWSKYITCRVHDLIRDVCLSKVKEEKVIDVFHLKHQAENVESKGSTVRRLCIRSEGDKDGNEIMLKPYDQDMISRIRSVLMWRSPSPTYGVWPDNILSLEKFKLLRVFTSSHYKFTSENIGSISELLFLKYLCLSSCHLDELPSTVVNLRHLETLDLRVWCTITIPNVLWKLKQLKHLYLPMNFQVSGTVEKLRFNGLDELELIENHDSESCDTDDLIQLRKLKVFDGTTAVEENLKVNIIDFIKTRQLRFSSLCIDGSGVLSLVFLLECCFIDKLFVRVRIHMYSTEYDHTRFSGRLTVLLLERCRMEEDPMPLLEKLPNLRYLSLGMESYIGAEMVCSATGFPQLQRLRFEELSRLEKWTVEEGAMPNVSILRINGCDYLKMLPEGLMYLTALESLALVCMHAKFNNRVRVIDGVEGQDFYKVRHVPRIEISYEFGN